MSNHKTGDRGQRYEFTCDDGEGKRMTLGWSNDPRSFDRMVELHPVWADLKVVDRLAGQERPQDDLKL